MESRRTDLGIVSTSDVPGNRRQGILQALFLDIPWVLDSAWRRLEFCACRSGHVPADGQGRFAPRSLAATPVFVSFLVTSTFFCFGPTLDSVCTAVNVTAFGWLRGVVGAVLLLASLVFSAAVLVECMRRLDARRNALLAAKKQIAKPGPPLAWRFGSARVLIAIGAAITVALPVTLGIYQLLAAHETLVPSQLSDPMCVPGPNRAAAAVQLVLWISCAVSGYFILRAKLAALWQFGLLLALFALTAWGLDFISNSLSRVLPSTEATGGPYFQIFVPIVLALLVVALIARVMAWVCFKSARKEIEADVRAALTTAHLMRNDRPDPPITCLRLWAAVFTGLGYHLLHLLLFPAMAALFAPSNYMWMLVSGVFLVGAMFVVWGSLARRWNQLLHHLRRWFLVGTPLVVSLAVIVIGGLRLVEVQYVSTIVDAAPFGTLFMLVVGAYAVLWFTEYWFNRWPGEELLGLLGAPSPEAGLRYREPLDARAATAVAGQEQVLALHGTGQIAVHGWYWENEEERKKPDGKRVPGFSTYGFEEFFEVLRAGADESAATEIVYNVRRRVRLYFGFVNLLIIVSVVIFTYLKEEWNHPLRQDRLVAADSTAVSAYAVDLAATLVRQARADRPAIIVAASGGGTRAAVYTAEALRGLARLGRAGDIVLASGVSGGGVALAYFASRFDELKEADARGQAWTDFRAAMGQPFIRDVLEGAAEVRILDTTPLGTLLKESFERRVFTTEAKTLGDLRALGLILNTTISGHPLRMSELLSGRVGASTRDAIGSTLNGDARRRADCLEQSRPYASLAGGRLLFTNIAAAREPFPPNRSALPDVRFPFRVVQDPVVSLAAASALNANFPPVFPNARVRLNNSAESGCALVSYFVTDGGATENLGLISALYALREALPRARAELEQIGKELPSIHVVAIEASAVTYDYEQDRGVGAAVGGSKERLAGGLTQELIDQITAASCPQGCQSRSLEPCLQDCPSRQLEPGPKFHELPLPLAFRSRGGFGTHWMFAKQIRVSNPQIAESRGRIKQWWRQLLGQPHYEILDIKDVEAVWSALYASEPPFCTRAWPDDKERKRLADWICGRDENGWQIGEADYQIGAWETLVRDLSPGAAKP